jgi:hypothetical protein
MADYRMVWLRDRISKAMGVQDTPDALENLMKKHDDEFQAFLDDDVHDVDELEKCIFHIYRTFYDRLVEREVVTIEKGKLNIPNSHLHLLCCAYIFFFTTNAILKSQNFSIP